MYEHQGFQEAVFMIFYGGMTMLAMMACLYLLFRRANAVAPNVQPSWELRRWAGAFMAAVAASHIWWLLLGKLWLEDDRLLRNVICEVLDYMTFLPLMMAMLVRMLQDRRRRVWPFFAAVAPVLVIAVWGVTTRSPMTEWVIVGWLAVVAFVYIIYMVRAVTQYGHWLRNNYADLEHKEVRQSLLLLAFITAVYAAYCMNSGGLVLEYLAQVNTLFIIVFIVWRVETLQHLEVHDAAVETAQNNNASIALPSNISELLTQHCENTGLYLQHDLTLTLLATAIGTNRTYLSTYFAQQGITYNAYINRLRIDHFKELYRKTANSLNAPTAADLAQQSGFRSYSTFNANFKAITGTSVTAWMKDAAHACQPDTCPTG
jgi:AraC-like DNA-binding protein